ncbi:MAG: hypothetical protein ACE5KA_05875 [Nitrososphaerales archaeon]
MTNKYSTVFEPSDDIVAKSDIKRFMNSNTISNYTELIKRSSENIEWYWDAVNKDLSIE